MYAAPQGDLWVGHRRYGVFHYDGKAWTRYDVRDGLADSRAGSIFQTRDGSVWIGTRRGKSRYDGRTWTTHALPPGVTGGLKQSQDGAIWIDRRVGDQVTQRRYAIRYDPDPDPPETEITLSLDEVSHPGNTTLAWRGADLWHSTPDRDLQYAWRLGEGEWSPFSKATYKTLLALSSGDHTFQVKARDRDFNEDPTPAVVQFTVVPPVWQQPWFIGMVVVLVGAIVLQTGRVIGRDRRLREEAEKELQVAHEMQMGLMPKKAPEIEGFDIAGRCIPANHVGGDFFQFFEEDGKLALSMADVTGKAMEAAIPVVMFDGMLGTQMEIRVSIEDLFGRLNRSLHSRLDPRTFICFTLGELDTPSQTFLFSNGGCPYPNHFRAETGGVAELQVDAYPLGVRPDTEYEVVEVQLQPGDCIIFCSDGITEADNPAGEQFGYERTSETILKACEEGLSAEATIDRILEVVEAFKGDAPQGDDMTCVVLRVEDMEKPG